MFLGDELTAIFNGNGYTEEWLAEAKHRGLLNLRSTAEALPYFRKPKNIDLFTKYDIFTGQEVFSRCDILLENYSKALMIEWDTMLEMAKKDIFPAVYSYIKRRSDMVLSIESEAQLVFRLSELCGCLWEKCSILENTLLGAREYTQADKEASYYPYYYECVFPAIQELRAVADEMKGLVGEKYRPYPIDGNLLFSV